MSSFKGTKGKWKTMYNGHYHEIYQLCEHGMQSFASIHQNQYLRMTKDDCKANALAMSKLPEMVKILEKIANMHPDSNPITIIKECQKLIKEATTI